MAQATVEVRLLEKMSKSHDGSYPAIARNWLGMLATVRADHASTEQDSGLLGLTFEATFLPPHGSPRWGVLNKMLVLDD